MAAAEFLGRLALVTGAASGIGRAVSKALAASGAKVVLADAQVVKATEHAALLHQGDHMVEEVDVASSQSVGRLMAKIKEKYGEPVSILVNSAGITRDSLFLKMSEEQWDSAINVNLKGTYLLNRAVAQAIVEKRGSGSIINIASIVGKMGNVGQANYAASKAGVIALTKTAAKELGRHGIRVNCVLPGFIETPMTSALPEKVVQQLLPLIPLGTFGSPEDVANVCLFLASDKSRYITGTGIEVTGGLFA